MENKTICTILVVSIALVIVVSGVAVSANARASDSTVSISSSTIHVPGDYATIQGAVDNVPVDGTIIVREDTYTESVHVNKRLTIKSEKGADKTIVHAFEVTSAYVKIVGFTVNGSTSKRGIYLINAEYCDILDNVISDAYKGIELNASSNNNITNNIASDNHQGIYLSSSSNNNTLMNNIASNNDNQGITIKSSSNNKIFNNTVSNNWIGTVLEGSSNNRVVGNNVSGNKHHNIRVSNSNSNNVTNNSASNSGLGIYLRYSLSNNITDNTCLSNGWKGIRLLYSSNNQLISNNVSDGREEGIYLDSYSRNNRLISNDALNNNNHGIFLDSSSSNNRIINNTVNSNHNHGIHLESSSNNVTENKVSNNPWGIVLYASHSKKNRLSKNTVWNNTRGICIGYSSNNTLIKNNVSDNADFGIYLESANNNTIYNNYFSNTNNSYDNGNNTWNITKTAGTDIVGGPYLGGNYWSDYDGKDTNTPADGLGDTKLPYNCSGGIRNGGDWHPLILKAPDLVIHEKHERWIDKATGTYNVSYTLKNVGDGTVSAGHRTSLFVDGVLKETKIVPVDLKPNGIYTDTFYTLLTISGENDTIKVCADYNDNVKESVETNNGRENIWEALPDLVILEIRRKPVDKVFGKYKIEYDIKNIGKKTASAGHNTSLFVDGTLKETKVVPEDLKHNGIYTDTFDTSITRSGKSDTIKVCAEHNNDVEESKETNNCKEKVWEALLKVNITLPVKNFEVQKDEKVDIVASVKDDLNNMANGSNIDTVVASFTTQKEKIDLYDDGKHKDGGKEDGVYGNTWTPTKTGDCTITVTAKKTDFKDCVDKVNGIVIAKPVLEIPAQFKNVHPYKNAGGEDAPVFQRGAENPQFKITNLTGTKPSGVKLIIDISEPQMGGGIRIVKNLTVTESWSATSILVDWDWSDNIGHRRPSNIPVGIYKAKAKLINSSTNRILIESDEKEFYVIFNYPKGELYVKSQNAYHTISCKGANIIKSGKYRLHQYNATIWKEALKKVHGNTTVRDASRELRSFAHNIGGKGYNYPLPFFWYGPQKNAVWDDTLKFYNRGSGVCADYSGLMTAYCRGVGIPSREMSAHGLKNNTEEHWGHAWAEAWDDRWYHHDPTWSLGGKFGADDYARGGVEFRPVINPWGYRVSAPGPGGLVATNVYDRYTFCADVTDFKFVDEPPEGYDYGQNVQFNVTVGNTGAINITKPLCVRIYDVPRGILVGAPVLIISERIANSLNSGQSVFRQFDQDLPDYGWLNSFYELIRGRDVMVVVFYVSSNNVCISTDTYKKSIPGLCVEPIPTITVDGENRELTNVTFTYLNQTTERSWKEETYVLDIPAVARILTEKEEAENYSKVVVSTENPDSVAHNYSFSMQLAGKGDAIYVPSLGSVTTNLTGLNVTTNYFVTYLQANGTNDYVSIHEFSKNATIESIEMIEYRGIKGLLINATWNQTLNRESSQDFSIYFSRRNVSGLSFSEIHSTFAGEIVDNEDSLSTIGITTSSRCRVGDILPINITVFNNGVKSETIDVMLNVTRVMKTIPYTTIGLYNDSAITTVQPQTERTVTFTADIPESTSSGFWDIDVTTDKAISAKISVMVEDAFDLNCTQNITVEQYSMFTFDTTVTNTWDTTVHDVNATIDLFYGFSTSDSLEQQIGDLLPNEKRTISWQLNATSSGELPIDVLVTSDDGGYDTVSSTITSLSPPDIWIPNIITHTNAPDFGTGKTVFLNVTIQNLGDLTANNVQVQLFLPENVTSTALTHDIGDLLGGEQENVSIDITFSTQKDFAFDVVAKDDANHSAIGTMMMSFSAITLPDLTLTSDNIQVIFNENIATISATIHNIGGTDTSNIVVQFFDGNPDAGGTQIGTDQIIASIAHESTGTAQMTWTVIPGTHDIFVRVDPYNTIQEAKEDNNQAYKQITIGGAKTIYVDDDFTDDPANHKWDTLQEGITDATDGDTVLVYNGTYTETVVLNKRLTLTGDGMPTIDAQDSGDAINITADNCTVKGFNCVNAQPSPYAGIRADSSNNVIVDNTCRDNYEGIYLLGTSNEIRNNIAKNNQHYGIRLQASDDNIIMDNTAKGNGASGIRLKASDYNSITDNDASNSVNYHGISVSSSNNNEVRNNAANSNHQVGIGLWSSCDNIIAKNTAKSNGNNGIYLKESNDNRITDNDVSNTVNYHGIYLKLSNNNDIRDNTANTNGEDGIYLNLSHDNRITGNDASNNVNYHGISLKSSNNNEVRNNVADSNHYDGIKLRNSTDNIILNNTAKNNEDDGISLTNSNNNRIYMNNFMDNDNNVKSEDSTNIWHSPSELDYIFKGNIYKNYLGNYWGDYTGSDTDNDGIGNSHYIINSDKDIYPLKKPLENYFVAPETNFDTGEPANPYPSTMGTHTGTIKPNQPITISKLYTYSCPGTGGHTEYIWIHGNGVDTSATWNGYQSTSDYHLIEFAAPVTLEEGVTYDYTIRTGSYPQMHHTSAVQTATGWLNCTAFEDKNGKVYYDRIPAVKFFY